MPARRLRGRSSNGVVVKRECTRAAWQRTRSPVHVAPNLRSLPAARAATTRTACLEDTLQQRTSHHLRGKPHGVAGGGGGHALQHQVVGDELVVHLRGTRKVGRGDKRHVVVQHRATHRQQQRRLQQQSCHAVRGGAHPHQRQQHSSPGGTSSRRRHQSPKPRVARANRHCHWRRCHCCLRRRRWRRRCVRPAAVLSGCRRLWAATAQRRAHLAVGCRCRLHSR